MNRAVNWACAAMALAVTSCAETTSGHNEAGFETSVHENPLWVFRAGSKEAADFKKNIEPKVIVTRVGAGPNNMTIRSSDAKTIDDHIAMR
ncbi:MAG: hypothetical protein AB7F67_05345 [Rhodospirillaceae bacterium]